ncbi:MAG TPA: DNA polymerase/3'-5' exonuclease PolX [Blastocatellia bacterium]|nr:DNA polymerase/3'-5' exonuclease PolX [Blastocatellia bacterium]
MDRFEIAAALQEIGLLLRISGKDQYRSQAYTRAAQAVSAVDGDFAALVRQKRLTDIKGIGQSLAGVIEELHSTGRSSLLDSLRSELPRGVLELSKIPGLTVTRIQALNQALGISSISDLKAALEAGKLRDIPGFGAKTEEALREQISRYDNRDDRILLSAALKIGERVIDYMRTLDEIVSIDLAGSIRRWKETVAVIRVTAGVSKSPQRALRHFLQYPPIIEVISKERNASTVTLSDGVKVSFSAASSNDYWNLLHHETGSRAHLEGLETIGKQKGIQLTSAKLKALKSRRSLSVSGEEDIYRHLDLQYVPPELREGDGEIAAARAGKIPSDLIVLDDIKGMVHCHTTFSDGRHSIEEMARASESMGMEYLTISDHSPTASYAGGLTLDRLKRQWEEISRVQEKVSIRLLRATESDILRDGALDYPDNILEKFDLIIASIHNRYKLDEDQMTKRVITALRNPLFKVWGHPLGRLLQRRPPISCRMEEILDVAGQSAAAIEISGSPHRLDLEPRWIKEARKRSIKFVISTDAHSVSELENLKFGIGIARRGGVRRREVLNTLGPAAFQRSVSSKA